MHITPLSMNTNTVVRNNNHTAVNTVQKSAQSTNYGISNVFYKTGISFGKDKKAGSKDKPSDYPLETFMNIINKKYPGEFKKSILIQNNKGNTPLHKTNAKKMQIMAESAPDEFKQALLIKNKNGKTPLFFTHIQIQ